MLLIVVIVWFYHIKEDEDGIIIILPILFEFEIIFFFKKDIELPDYSQRGQDNYEFLEVSRDHTLSDMDIENLSDDGTLCNFIFSKCFF